MVLHYAIEMVINPNKIEENTKKIEDIIKDFESATGEVPFHWKWILNTKIDKKTKEVHYVNVEKILDNLGINTLKRYKNLADDIMRDRVSTEVTVSMPEIGLAGTVDLLVEHADGTYTVVDWKTGNNFSGRPELENLFLLKYGDQGNKEITDSPRNRAKIQMAIYAMLLKANNPGMKFRALKVGWIPNEYIIKMKDTQADTDASSYIPMIEELLSDEKLLKENGFDPKMKEKLLAKDANMFKPSEYSQNAETATIQDEIHIKGKSPAQIFDEKVARIRYLTSKNINYEALDSRDKTEIQQLTEEVSQMMQDPNMTISADDVRDMNLLERHLGNYSEVNHPLVMQWKNFKNSRERAATVNAHRKIEIFRSLLRPVAKEIEKELGIVNILGNKNYDYDKAFGWMYVKMKSEDGTETERERLLTPREKDPELKARWDALSPAKKKLLNYVNNTFKDYFVGEKAFMNQTATYDSKGNALTQLDLYNKKKRVGDKREYYDGFFFKVPITEEEVVLRAGGGSYLKGLFSKNAIKRMLFEKATMFRERNYENWFDDSQALPVKYLGNEYIDTAQNYTHSIEEMFVKAVTEMERVQQMQDVYALGMAIRDKLATQRDPSNPMQPMYKNLVKFLDAKLVHDVQKRSINMKWGNTKRVRIPMYNIYTGKTENYPISIDKLLLALRSWGSMVTMWARPFRGIGNGLQAVLLTHREGIKGSIAKMKFLGISGDAIDFDEGDIAKAEAEYIKDFGPHVIGDVRKSKMYLIAKELDFFGNNFDYHLLDREALTKRNKRTTVDLLYGPYSIPEEFVSMTTMTAMLMHMKNANTGKSIWDSYERYEILDENGKGTGEYSVRWIGGVRGTVKKGDGETAQYGELKELNEREIAHLKKVHERLQGNYRREEALAMEAYTLGKLFMQLKRYYPRLLLNGVHSKRIETDLGAYRPVKDKDGNIVTMKTKDGKEMPVYEWYARVSEGRWVTISKYLFHIASLGKMYREHGWNNLTDEQRMNIIEATVVLGQWIAFYGMYLAFFGDAPDDDTTKKLWKQYLVDNLSQQYNLADLFRTAKSFTTPVTLAKSVDLVMSSGTMLMAGANYAIGNEDAAFTNKGDLRGWNNFVKGVPLLASYKDIERMLENDTSGTFNFADWMYGGVKLK
jgi:hypothetical protein